jgi:hypothetical protein
MPTWHVNLRRQAIAPELAEHWSVAIAVAAAAIDAAEDDRDLEGPQASARRRALLAERHWLEGISGS